LSEASDLGEQSPQSLHLSGKQHWTEESVTREWRG
jgi:hypothetical protein